jgi:hypothetical protein
VFWAHDLLTGEQVAIKWIKDVFSSVPDATRILREIKLLRLLQHKDVVGVRHVVRPAHESTFRDIYVVGGLHAWVGEVMACGRMLCCGCRAALSCVGAAAAQGRGGRPPCCAAGA